MHKAFLQNNDIKSSKSRLSHLLLHKLDLYLSEVQLSLDSVLDKRLVRTFYDLIVAILLHRHNSMGLLLSELGGYICGLHMLPLGQSASVICYVPKNGHLLSLIIFSLVKLEKGLNR
jgi:hypothetical protein